MSDSRSGLIRPESLLKDYNAMYFLNVVDEQDLPVNEAEQKEEEEGQQLDWKVTNFEKYENYAEFDEAAHLESKGLEFRANPASPEKQLSRNKGRGEQGFEVPEEHLHGVPPGGE